jgi:hypothetical protein
MAESLFELLFKYRPLLFQRGEIAFALPPLWLAVLAGILAAAAALTYGRARGRAGGRDRAVLAALRLALLAIVLLLLARPVLLIQTVVPQENYLGILLDDSRSMRIDDDVSRAGFVQEAFLDAGGGLLAALGQRFRLRLYRFSEVAERIRPDTVLDFAGDRTRLGPSLDRVRDELSSLPLSGLVLVTDGADHDPEGLDEALLQLRAGGVPVYTVGIGSESFRRDIEVAGVTVPTEGLSGSAVVADVVLEHSGYDGRTVPVTVERDGRIVGTRDVRLDASGETSVRIDFEVGAAGPATFLFRVPVLEDELVDLNNEQERTIRVRSGRERILYFEGEPRHEVAFLRRAVADDPTLQLVVLQRSDAERYLRLGVDSATELAGGFPRSREELFRYRGLVLGSVEASHFTHDQLTMIEEFVERRGGGLLALGGRRALAEGGWSGTPVAEALPVRLDRVPAADTLFYAEITVQPTRTAAIDPVTRMEEGAPVIPWSELPALTAFNRVGGVKAGATTLLTGSGPGLDRQPVLAHQRYGRGRAAVFAVQDTWLWQMHADVPLEDETHERLWRQLLRWLVSGTPDRLVAEVPSAPVAPGDVVEVRAEVRDERYAGVSNAAVTAAVRAPSGATRELPLEWSLARDGEYRARFVAEEAGEHTVTVSATHDSLVAETEPAALRVAPSTEEYFGARMNPGVLERIAAETGGRFYAGEEVTHLPEDVAYTARGATVIEEKELWDAPAAFAAILLLISLEWMYRRRRGLA